MPLLREVHTVARDPMAASLNFQALFELSPNAYVLLDRELRIVTANPAYLRATRSTLEGLVGRRLLERFPHDPADPDNESVRRLRGSLERVLSTGEPDVLAAIPYRVPGEGGDGSEVRYWSATHTPVLREGQVAFVLQHTVDVTDFVSEAGHSAEVGAGVLGRALEVERRNTLLDAEMSHLRGTFEQAPGFLAILRGPDHVFELANEAYLRLVGRADVIGRPVREALPEVAGQGLFELLDEVFATGRAHAERGRRVMLRGPDGVEEKFVDFVFHPLTGDGDRVRGIFVQGHDVTEQVRAVRELRFLAEAIPQQVWTATPDGEVDYVNSRFADYFGAPPEAVKGSGWRAVAHPDDLERTASRWARSLATGEPYEVECRLRRVDGTYRWFLGRAMPFRDASGRIVKWFGTNTDVDESRAASEELRARTEYERLLIAIVSHDLRNPLAAISMAAELLLRRGGLDTRQGRAVARIAGSAERASRLISDLLDFSRTRFAGRLPVAISDVSLGELIAEVVDEVLPGAPHRSVSVRHEGEDAGRWDRDRLAQAVGNLLSNALQHSPEDASVAVRSRIEHGVARIAIHNEGPPIAPGEAARLFEPFVRGGASGSVSGSVGLGLYIVKQIAVAHGGTVEVRSRAGEGTTFELVLPRYADRSEAPAEYHAGMLNP